MKLRGIPKLIVNIAVILFVVGGLIYIWGESTWPLYAQVVVTAAMLGGVGWLLQEFNII